MKLSLLKPSLWIASVLSDQGLWIIMTQKASIYVPEPIQVLHTRTDPTGIKQYSSLIALLRLVMVLSKLCDFFLNSLSFDKRYTTVIIFSVWLMTQIWVNSIQKTWKKNHSQKLLIIDHPTFFHVLARLPKRLRNRNPVPPKAP